MGKTSSRIAGGAACRRRAIVREKGRMWDRGKKIPVDYDERRCCCFSIRLLINVTVDSVLNTLKVVRIKGKDRRREVVATQRVDQIGELVLGVFVSDQWRRLDGDQKSGM